MEEVIVIPGIQHRLYKHLDDGQMAHAAEATVRGMDRAAHNAELAIPHVLAEQVILSIERSFVKAAQPVKRGLLK